MTAYEHVPRTRTLVKERGEKSRMVTRQEKSLLLVGLLVAALVGSTRLSSALEVGDNAPDFTLPSTNGKKISLSQFRGKKYVLLEFYVNDFGAT
jgi:peroxiredoxin Q/BCP